MCIYLSRFRPTTINLWGLFFFVACHDALLYFLICKKHLQNVCANECGFGYVIQILRTFLHVFCVRIQLLRKFVYGFCASCAAFAYIYGFLCALSGFWLRIRVFLCALSFFCVQIQLFDSLKVSPIRSWGFFDLLKVPMIRSWVFVDFWKSQWSDLEGYLFARSPNDPILRVLWFIESPDDPILRVICFVEIPDDPTHYGWSIWRILSSGFHRVLYTTVFMWFAVRSYLIKFLSKNLLAIHCPILPRTVCCWSYRAIYNHVE